MLSNILKFYNLTKSKKTSFDPNLYVENLPTKYEFIAYRILYKQALEQKNINIVKGLNPHNISIDEIDKKVIDVYYATEKINDKN